MTAVRFSSVKFSYLDYACELSHKLHFIFKNIYIYLSLLGI